MATRNIPVIPGVNHPDVLAEAEARDEKLADEQFYEDMRKQPAQLTHEQYWEIEARFRKDAGGPDGAGPWRRSALASLTRSMQQLMDSVAGDIEAARALAYLSVQTDAYVKQLESLVEMLKTASLRIEIALCVREDMQTLLEVARTTLPDGSEARSH